MTRDPAKTRANQRKWFVRVTEERSLDLALSPDQLRTQRISELVSLLEAKDTSWQHKLDSAHALAFLIWGLK